MNMRMSITLEEKHDNDDDHIANKLIMELLSEDVISLSIYNANNGIVDIDVSLITLRKALDKIAL